MCADTSGRLFLILTMPCRGNCHPADEDPEDPRDSVTRPRAHSYHTLSVLESSFPPIFSISETRMHLRVDGLSQLLDSISLFLNGSRNTSIFHNQGHFKFVAIWHSGSHFVSRDSQWPGNRNPTQGRI